jgi:hypothetical protein
MSVLIGVLAIMALVLAYWLGWSDRGMEEQFNRDLDRIEILALHGPSRKTKLRRTKERTPCHQKDM